MNDKAVWKPSKELAERAVIHFVRWYKGIDVVQADEKVKGWTPEGYEHNQGGSRSFKPKSEVTFPKHHELTDEDYMRLVTLQKHKDRVLKLLGDDLEHLYKEDVSPRYRMPYRAAKRLDTTFGVIANEFKFYEESRFYRLETEVDQETLTEIREEARRRRVPVKRVAREWLRSKSQENRANSV